MTGYHMVVGIAGLEKRLSGEIPEQFGSWQILTDEKGNFLSRSEVEAEIARCKKLGYTCIPTCKKVDKDGRCKGHKS